MIDAICTAIRFPAGGFLSEIATPLPLSGGLRSVGPFLNVARALPKTLAPGELPQSEDVRPHPHIGICVMSHLYEGAMTHRDSLGETREIEPGAVSWTAAGRGIVHSERYERLRRHGGSIHGLQVWVALPEANEDDDPFYQHVAPQDLPRIDHEGVSGRLLLGRVGAHASPAVVRSPLYMIDVHVAKDARYAPPEGFEERAIYVIAGALALGDQTIAAGQTALLTSGASGALIATADAHLLAYGGAPIGRRLMWWNLAASSADRIEAAKAAWRSQTFTLPPDDFEEFTPLPADHERPVMILNA